MSFTYTLEKRVAISAVKRACSLTSSVFNKLVKDERIIKEDQSPVTVADFAAQATISPILRQVFPQDQIIGEEDTSELRADDSPLQDRVVHLANEALTIDLSVDEDTSWGIGPGSARSANELLKAIDRGDYGGGRTGRMWTIDPIDGTKGFLRGEQYAVCLALLVDAEVQVSVMGCPNLPVRMSEPDGPRGCLFVAVRGQGAEQCSLFDPDVKPIRLAIQPMPQEQLNFLESVEPAHSSLDFNARVATILNITRMPTRMDSQVKYCALARGDGGAYVRMPVGNTYQEKIWDHASGSLLVEEAGGVVTDSRGIPLDFGLGRTLGENHGIVAAGKGEHARVLGAIRKAWDESNE